MPADAKPERPPGTEWRAVLVGLLLLGWLAVLVVARMSPPDVLPRDAAADVFSAERARVHVEQLAREPHPSGSPAARQVEAYLVRTLEGLGLRVQVQAAPACTEAAGLRRCAHVRNVIATLPGRVHEGAVLLSAHYDSVSNAAGAGDDASAVAALLETARALTRGEPLERDVIFALLDAEEDLLLGSAAFCRAGTDLSRVRLVANFDARGSRGAVTLIGHSRGSAGLISALIPALPRPVLSSFYPSVAEVLPNATDAEIYDECGLRTLSFAFADGFENYHQGTDTPDRLDDRSVQHHGSYALAIARRFAGGDLDAASDGEHDLVFFDVGAAFVVRYTYATARWLALGLMLVTVLVVWRRLRSLGIGVSALLLAAAGFLAVLVTAALGGALVTELVTLGWRPWLAHLHAGALAACAACFVGGAVLLLTAAVRRRAPADLLALGPLLVWVALACLTAVLAPGTSHLFLWPAAALLVAWSRQPRHAGRGIVEHVALLVPAVLLLMPVAYTLLVVIGDAGVAGAMLCLALFLGAGSEPMRVLATRARALSIVLFSVGALLALALQVRVRTELAPPVANAVSYALDAPAQRALWVSPDARVDAWKRQFLGVRPERGPLAAFGLDRAWLMNAAPVVALEPPTLELVTDRWIGDERSLVLRARSPRAARTFRLWEETGVQFSRFGLDGSVPVSLIRFSPELDQKLLRWLTGLNDAARWSVTLFSLKPEGSLLTLSTQHAGALELRGVDRSEGLALFPDGYTPRSSEFTPGYPGDHTLVSGALLRVAPLPRPEP
jgi:peptidase M28-like protein